jgi:hydroxymethylbilane synthase
VPLAAHAVWQGDALCIDVALGDAQALQRPLLRAQCRAAVADAGQADALGLQAAARLREAGADAYLAAAG